MTVDDLTIRDARELSALFGASRSAKNPHPYLGKYVIVRTYSAGSWCGVLSEKDGNEVILTCARRMYRWWAAESISLCAVAIYGVKADKCKIVEAVPTAWMEAIEIIPVSTIAELQLRGMPNVKAE